MTAQWAKLSAVMVATALSGGSALAETPSAPLLSLAQAKAVADRAERAAAEKKIEVAIVVVNREGRVILSHRMDGVSFVNLALAEKKAVTAAATGVPTSILEQAVDGGKPSLLSVPEISPVGGAVPLMLGARVIGGVGISGGSTADDEKIASAGADR
jgi:uncharacterized protein GlcG (DUF336 family)